MDITDRHVNNANNEIAPSSKVESLYTWKITDPSTIIQMKSAKNQQKWKSDK